jgi:hypothetical protein
MNAISQMKLGVLGSLRSVTHDVIVFSATFIFLASSFCCTLFCLSLILSHLPNVIVSPRMEVATLRFVCGQVYLCYLVLV